MLVKYVSTKKHEWSKYIDTCVFAYNTSRHESTKFTPFEIMFNRTATLSIDIAMRKKSPEVMLHLALDPVHESNTEELLERRNKKLMMVKENITAAQAKQKRDYDLKHAKPSLFRVGALVLAKDHTRKKRKGGKLDTRWLGPFKIEKVLPRGIYHIISPNGSKRSTLVLIINLTSNLRKVCGMCPANEHYCMIITIFVDRTLTTSPNGSVSNVSTITKGR